MPDPAQIERNLAVGRRLRDARERLLISQTLFATQAQISQPRLAKYEMGVVSLPWAVGEKLCRIFNINPVWLATGDGTMFGAALHLDSEALSKQGSRPHFDTVVETLVTAEQGAKREIAVRHLASGHANEFKNPGDGPQAPVTVLSPVQSDAWAKFANGPLRIVYATPKDSEVAQFSRELAEMLVAVLERRLAK